MASSIVSCDRIKYTNYIGSSQQGENCFLNQPVLYKPWFYTRCAIAAKHIHTGLLSGIMRSPMQFFDTNPLGRIINRFSSDIDLMDMMIPFQISDFVWCLTEVVATLIVISLAVPIFLSAIIPIILIFVVIQQLYIVTSRQLKRLYSVSKSPIFSHFSETVSGAQIIRAFKVKIKMIS